MRTFTRATTLGVLFGVVLACDGPSEKPYLRFTYSGEATGTFAVAGKPPPLPTTTSAGVAGMGDCADGGLVFVIGVANRGATKADLAQLLLPCNATGTISLTDSCLLDSCGVFGYSRGLDGNGGTEL